MADIVILGAGLGGLPMAYEMKDLARKEDRVFVVSDKDYYHFVPSNPWVAVDWRKREDITVPLDKPLKKRGIELVVNTASKVIPGQNQIEFSNGDRLSYDHLIIATGPRLAFEEIEGLGPEGYTTSVCHIDHAEKGREQWLDFVKQPGPIVVGAVQGASCFGPAYEMAFVMDADLRKRKLRDQVPMTFVTPEPYIGHLGLDGVGDSKTMLESELRKRHIDWICNARVDRVEDGLMHVIECDADGNEKARHEVPFGYSMMLPAFTGIDAVRDVEGLSNPRGFIQIDKHQRNPAHPNIWSVGVAVAIAPKKPTPVPTGVPKSGFMIESMVTATAHNIRAVLDGKEPQREATWNAVCLADMGDTGIAFVAMPQIPPRNVSWMKSGKWVHLAKIGFEKYFLHKIRSGVSEPVYEKMLMKSLGIGKLKEQPKKEA
jgi:sulfide:quinone oxidoreductase